MANFLSASGNEIRKGLFIFKDKKPFEIEAILSAERDYYLICNDYEIVGYDKFLNSIEIKKTEFSSFLKLNVVKQKTYEKKCCNQSLFIIIETLDLVDIQM